MCVGSDSKVDKITIAHSLLPSGLVLNLNKCYFGVCVEHEYDLIMFIAKRLFI